MIVIVVVPVVVPVVVHRAPKGDQAREHPGLPGLKLQPLSYACCPVDAFPVWPSSRLLRKRRVRAKALNSAC